MKLYLLLVHSRKEFELDKSKFVQVRQFRANFQKIQNLKNLNSSIDFGEIQYQRSLIDIVYLCAVLRRRGKFYKSQIYHKHLWKNSKSRKILNRWLIFVKIVTNKGNNICISIFFQQDILSFLSEEAKSRKLSRTMYKLLNCCQVVTIFGVPVNFLFSQMWTRCG